LVSAKPPAPVFVNVPRLAIELMLVRVEPPIELPINVPVVIVPRNPSGLTPSEIGPVAVRRVVALTAIGALIDIPPIAELIPAAASSAPAIVTLLLNTIEPPALNTNDRFPPDPVSLIGELTIMLPVPVPPCPFVKAWYAAPASSVSETVLPCDNVIAPSVPPGVAPKKMFPV